MQKVLLKISLFVLLSLAYPLFVILLYMCTPVQIDCFTSSPNCISGLHNTCGPISPAISSFLKIFPLLKINFFIQIPILIIINLVLTNLIVKKLARPVV